MQLRQAVLAVGVASLAACSDPAMPLDASATPDAPTDANANMDWVDGFARISPRTHPTPASLPELREVLWVRRAPIAGMPRAGIWQISRQGYDATLPTLLPPVSLPELPVERSYRSVNWDSQRPTDGAFRFELCSEVTPMGTDVRCERWTYLPSTRTWAPDANVLPRSGVPGINLGEETLFVVPAVTGNWPPQGPMLIDRESHRMYTRTRLVTECSDLPIPSHVQLDLMGNLVVFQDVLVQRFGTWMPRGQALNVWRVDADSGAILGTGRVELRGMFDGDSAVVVINGPTDGVTTATRYHFDGRTETFNLGLGRGLGLAAQLVDIDPLGNLLVKQAGYFTLLRPNGIAIAQLDMAVLTEQIMFADPTERF